MTTLFVYEVLSKIIDFVYDGKVCFCLKIWLLRIKKPRFVVIGKFANTKRQNLFAFIGKRKSAKISKMKIFAIIGTIRIKIV